MKIDRFDLTRRAVLQGAAVSLLPLPAMAVAAPPRILRAAPALAPVAAPEHAETRVWGYDGSVPGPTLRVRQGDTLHVRFENGLPQPSSIHWHGLRLDNAMDGVAGLTQPPVPPGGSFDYSFTAPDAGTFWYHPHFRSWEQMARGLYGALIVEEPAPPAVDRDLVLMFDDWRIDEAGQVDEASLGSMMDASHAGRLGNWLTVNGRSRPEIAVAKGERLRLRLVNAANSRILSLAFEDHLVQVIAIDGQPVAPYPAEHGVVVLAPAQRVDLIVDAGLDPGSRTAILAVSARDRLESAYLAYDRARVRRESPSAAPIRLPDNPLPKRLDLDGAKVVDLVMEGGAMGRMGAATFRGRRLGIRELAQQGMIWAFNGVAGRTDTPLLEVPRGRTVAIDMINDTGWPHAMHLHGHHFRVVWRNGKVTPGEPWRDTVLLDRGEKARIAFVADNPGKWLFHCHMLEHQAAGMSTWISVGG